MGSKSRKQFTVRLSQQASRTVELLTKQSGLSVSDFFEHLVERVGGDRDKSNAATQAAVSGIDSDILLREFDDIRGQVETLGNYFERLVLRLNDVIRTPSFLEFRAMEQAAGVDYGELSPYAKLLAQAQTYYALYNVWPSPDNPAHFGSYPDNSKWPRNPPEAKRAVKKGA